MTAFYTKGRLWGRDGYYINLAHHDAYFYTGTLSQAKKNFCLDYGIAKQSSVTWLKFN